MDLSILTCKCTPVGLLLCIVLCNAGAEAVSYEGAVPQRGVRFLAAEINYNRTYLRNVTTDTTNGCFSVDLWTLKDIVAGFMIELDIQISISSNKKRFQSILTYTVDICQLMNNVLQTNLLRKWLLNVIKYSNVKPFCPLEVGHYYIRNFTAERGNVPAYLQPGDYRMKTHHYYKIKRGKQLATVARFMLDFKIY